MFQSYTNKQLNNIARDNYEVLRSYCQILEREGYWDGVKAVMKQSIYAFLDVYVQTVLINLIPMRSASLRISPISICLI